jgi:hypothetical protein
MIDAPAASEWVRGNRSERKGRSVGRPSTLIDGDIDAALHSCCPSQAALIASDEVEVRRAATTAAERLFERADSCHRQSRSRVALGQLQALIGH